MPGASNLSRETGVLRRDRYRRELDPAGHRIRALQSRPVPRSPVRGLAREVAEVRVGISASEPPLSSGCSAAGALRRDAPALTVSTRDLRENRCLGHPLHADGQLFAEAQGTQARGTPSHRSLGSARSIRWKTCSCMAAAESRAVAKVETLWFGRADLSGSCAAASIGSTDRDAVRSLRSWYQRACAARG